MNPFVLVIFGATGDLAHNKLIPALFSLYKDRKLPSRFFIIGFARREFSDEEFAALFNNSQTDGDEEWRKFTRHLMYQSGTFEDDNGYLLLEKKLKSLEVKLNKKTIKIFYLATPPYNYEIILDNLEKAKLTKSHESTRIAIEKPFGKNLEHAKFLDLKLSEMFDEQQIFRVDHYLGKETVQNLLVFRFANSIFEPIWNNEYIDHVQIAWAEKKGIDRRGKFFDGVGLLRDVGQNHLMQLIAAVTMDMPRSFTREDVRNSRAKAIRSIECLNPESVSGLVVRGQYRGYRDEGNVDKNSRTETFLAMKLFVDTPKFRNIPFYIRAGKAMAEHSATISIVFKQTCHLLFKEIGCPEEGNILTIRIQPNEGLFFKIISKSPGTKLALQSADMHFSYHEAFGTQGSDAYAKLLLDIIQGDQILFNRSDELVSSWQFITNILEGWESEKAPLFLYDRGTMGPKEADDLITKDNRKWL